VDWFSLYINVSALSWIFSIFLVLASEQYQQSRLPGMDWTLLDTMLQKLGMSCQTISGKKHLSINAHNIC
jgi:hypothetical protein